MDLLKTLAAAKEAEAKKAATKTTKVKKLKATHPDKPEVSNFSPDNVVRKTHWNTVGQVVRVAEFTCTCGSTRKVPMSGVYLDQRSTSQPVCDRLVLLTDALMGQYSPSLPKSLRVYKEKHTCVKCLKGEGWKE